MNKLKASGVHINFTCFTWKNWNLVLKIPDYPVDVLGFQAITLDKVLFVGQRFRFFMFYLIDFYWILLIFCGKPVYNGSNILIHILHFQVT